METTEPTRGNEPLLLRIHPDVTELTKLGRTTIYQEIQSGRLPAVRIGRAVRVRRSDLLEWLDRQAHAEPQPA